MYIQKSICLFVLEMALLAYSCAMLGQDEIDAEIREEMTAWHDEVRTPGLAAIRRNHNLSDDEFSSRLVKLATVTTNGQDATLRMFTVAAIGDFGTTNALVFLEKEVRRGNVSAISEYGVITGYDDRFFELAEPLVVDKRKESWGRREPVYNAFRSLLNKNDIRNREIPIEIRKRAIAHLISWANEDVYYADYIDQILSEKEETYRTNAIRHEIARFALNNPESSDYTRNYFKNVLQQIGYAPKNAEEWSSAKTAAREAGKQTGDELSEPTFGRSVGNMDCPTSSETVDADTPSTHTWLYIVIGGVLLLALAFLFVRWRRLRYANHNTDHIPFHQ